MLLPVIVAAAFLGCGESGSSSTRSGELNVGGAKAKRTVSRTVERCVDLWNLKELVGVDREIFTDSLLEITEGGVAVSRDPSGICVVAFPRIVGNRPGSLIWLYEHGRWVRYLSIKPEEDSANPTAGKARGDRVSKHVTVLEYRARESPNVRLVEGGSLTVLGN